MKLSRKQKLLKWGRKLRGKKLKGLLKSVRVIYKKYPESAEILPYNFCPECGCRGVINTGNRAAYPEVYMQSFCARCGVLLGEADNSPFISWYEWADPNPEYNAALRALNKLT